MKFALDIGNSTVKGSVLDDNNHLLNTITEPSAVNYISEEKYLTYNNDEFYFKVESSKLNHSDKITVVFTKAIDLPDYLEYDVESTSYKANHEITTALLFGSILQHVNESTDVKLAVSVPIVEAKSIELLKTYRNLLLGEHSLIKYTKEGSSLIKLNVLDVVVLNEGQAGFLGMLDSNDEVFASAMEELYNALGEEESPIADFEDFLIVDIGEGTTDLAVFRNKKFNAEYSYSVTRGYGNLLEDAISNANRENITIESRKDLQKLLTTTNKRRTSRREKWLPYVEPTKDRFVDTIVDTIIKTYANRDYFDAIIFLGGGFTALTGYTVQDNEIITRDNTLFERLEEKLKINKKDADLIFGIPEPFAQSINDRGLVQVLLGL
jgi:hypothetical protein